MLEELVTAELESALQEVSGEGWAGTSEERASAILCDDLAETTDQTLVVGDGIELDAGLDAVELLISLGLRIYMITIAFVSSLHSSSSFLRADMGEDLHIYWCHAAVRKGTAYCTSKSEARVEVNARELLGRGNGLDFLFNGIQLGAARRCRGGGHCEGCIDGIR